MLVPGKKFASALSPLELAAWVGAAALVVVCFVIEGAAWVVAGSLSTFKGATVGEAAMLGWALQRPVSARLRADATTGSGCAMGMAAR